MNTRPVLFIVILSTWVVPCWSQTTKSGKAETAGPCSPAVTGNHNAFTITCGIGKAQGDTLLKIVNKILSNQTDLRQLENKLDEVLKGVNDIRQSSAARRLSASQRLTLFLAISSFSGQKVTIVVPPGNPEAYRFAQDFADVFKSAGLTVTAPAEGADKTGVNEVLTFGGPPLTGVVIQPKDEDAWRKPIVQAMVRALAKAEIKHTVQYRGGGLAETDFDLYVGPRPPE